MDQIVELPTTKSGYDSIVVYVDRFTKMMHCQPTHTNVKAPELAKIFFDTVVRLHGLPDDIVSDRDPKFTGHFWRALFKHVGVKLSMSTAHHPQSDGQTERDNRTLESIIRNFVSTNFDNWDTLLPAAEFSYNSSKQKSTQETPFFLNYGMHLVTPLDRIANVPVDTDVAATTDFLKTIKIANESAHAHITMAEHQQKKGYNGLREDYSFKVGDLIKLSTKDTPIEKGPAYKLKPRYVGPLEVLKVVSPVAYRITLPENWRIHNVIHISRLRPWHEKTEVRTEPAELPPPPPPVQDDKLGGFYTVERILKKERDPKTERFKFLVKFTGYDDSENMWLSWYDFTPDMRKIASTMPTTGLDTDVNF